MQIIFFVCQDDNVICLKEAMQNGDPAAVPEFPLRNRRKNSENPVYNEGLQGPRGQAKGHGLSRLEMANGA